jgi:hypothetical protein
VLNRVEAARRLIHFITTASALTPRERALGNNLVATGFKEPGLASRRRFVSGLVLLTEVAGGCLSPTSVDYVTLTIVNSEFRSRRNVGAFLGIYRTQDGAIRAVTTRRTVC